jgi:protein CpxP
MASRFQHRLAAAAVLAALALPTLAQTTAPAAPATPTAASTQAPEAGHRHKAGERHHGNHAEHAKKRAEKRAEHQAKRQAAFKQQLNLSVEQEQAWTTYTAAIQPGERKARLDFRGMDKLTTPERIDRMRALRAQHAAEADRRGEATKAFYATLTPEQQKTFDAKTHQRPRHHAKAGMQNKGDGEGRHHGRHGHHGPRGAAQGAQGAPAAPAQQ